jgi:hypothetical protein
LGPKEQVKNARSWARVFSGLTLSSLMGALESLKGVGE